jgi:hypothetical protein
LLEHEINLYSTNSSCIWEINNPLIQFPLLKLTLGISLSSCHDLSAKKIYHQTSRYRISVKTKSRCVLEAAMWSVFDAWETRDSQWCIASELSWGRREKLRAIFEKMKKLIYRHASANFVRIYARWRNIVQFDDVWKEKTDDGNLLMEIFLLFFLFQIKIKL